MGLLGEVFSYGDGLKRKLRGLLDDPAGTLALGVTRFGEDQRGLLNLQDNAYPMRGDKTVLNSPKQINSFRSELSDKSAEQAMAGMMLFHGSKGPGPIEKIKGDGMFGGLFASPSRRSAESHGDAIYRMTVPDASIMNVGDELPWDHVTSTIGKNIRANSPHLEDIADMVVGAKSAFNSSIPEDDLLHALRASDLVEADWELQRLRGLLGKSAGYKAVQMPDEHGMSYLVLPGTHARPENETARKFFKK